jgi:hypothetical protein
MYCIFNKIFNIMHNKEVLYRRDSSQADGFIGLPTLERGGRGEPVKAGKEKS